MTCGQYFAKKEQKNKTCQDGTVEIKQTLFLCACVHGAHLCTEGYDLRDESSISSNFRLLYWAYRLQLTSYSLHFYGVLKTQMLDCK